MGLDTSVWSIRTPNPHNDIMRSREDLAAFTQVFKLLLNEIKAAHGEDSTISVFPALPVSAAVEVGRSWMPKADLPLLVYDQQPTVGFKAAFCIKENEVA